MNPPSQGTPPPTSPAAPTEPHPQTHTDAPLDERGMRPVGTLGVIGLLTVTISTLWLLALGILEGRS